MSYEDGEMETTEMAESSEEGNAETVETDSVAEAAPEAETETSAPEAAAEAAPEYNLPEFDFDSWGGEVDSLPEIYRPIHERINTGVRREIDDLRNSLEQDRELYQALLEGENIGEDFRKKLTEAQSQIEKMQKSQEGWGSEREKYEAQIKGYQERMAEVEAAEQAEANRWAEGFRKEHADVFQDETLTANFNHFLNANIDPDIAMDFVRSGNEDYIRSALGYMSQGVPQHYAARLARADSGQSQTQAAKPRASAEMTAGATETANVPESAEKSVSDKTFNIKDARKLAVERAFKRRTG